ncbi:hypothetical protein BDW75DRAFT_250543 [Aspergillus navahoensis]
MLAFLHEHGVYLMDFSSSTIWIRDDLSIALSGYEIETYYPTNPKSGHPELSPKVDLSDWATFVWQLMRKGESSHGTKSKQRLKEGKLQLLEEERLGPMLVKAWKGEYENAREILQEVRSYLPQNVREGDGRPYRDVP